jgi:hypothetical protein
MRLANLTTRTNRKANLLVLFSLSTLVSFAQENSPYSRYGMGDLVPNQSIASRSMGGISTAVIDFFPIGRVSTGLNISNPASLGYLNSTVFDFGVELDRRTLRSNTSPSKYSANNLIISYLQLGLPLTTTKMAKKGNSMGVSFGLKPVSKVNYKILATQRLTGIDSVATLFEGTGGINQVNVSTGIKLKNFSFGVTGAYNFGNKETNTKREFINDTVTTYASSNSDVKTVFGGLSLSIGSQYAFKFKDTSTLIIGFNANLKHNLNGKKDQLDETFLFDANGATVNIDTAYSKNDLSGKISMPSNYTIGFTYSDKNSHWLVGSDFTTAQWANYRNYGVADALKNSSKIHIGAQYFPAKINTPASKYWQFVKYRAGFYYGNDYVNLGTKRPDYGFTFGTAMPLTSLRRFGGSEFVLLNTGIEIGQRGSKQNQSLREGVFRMNFGVAISTSSWFQKRKYY